MDKKFIKFFRIAFAILFLAGVLGAMMSETLKSKEKGEQIAVIEVKGEITGGQSGSSLMGGTYAGAETIMRQIRVAAKSKDIKALLLHINSPGGSAPASEEVYLEILRFKAKTKKPVLAVMGDTAASGGYFIAVGADEIYANPSTMTGSIGVIMQFKNYEKLYDKYGVKVATIKSGKYKDIGNPAREMSKEEQVQLQEMVNQIYERFVSAVVKGRNLSKENVLKLAQGQIYTGMEAQKLKLVDHLGNFYDAVEYLGKKVGIKGEPTLVYYTSSPSLIARLLGWLTGFTAPVLSEEKMEVMFIEEALKMPGVGHLQIRY